MLLGLGRVAAVGHCSEAHFPGLWLLGSHRAELVNIPGPLCQFLLEPTGQGRRAAEKRQEGLVAAFVRARARARAFRVVCAVGSCPVASALNCFLIHQVEIWHGGAFKGSNSTQNKFPNQASTLAEQAPARQAYWKPKPMPKAWGALRCRRRDGGGLGGQGARTPARPSACTHTQTSGRAGGRAGRAGVGAPV